MEISESVLEMGKKYKNVGIETLLISFIITHVSKQHMRKKAIEINNPNVITTNLSLLITGILVRVIYGRIVCF